MMPTKRASDTTCSRCGEPCEHGPWRVQLCNRCALELGEQEVADRRRQADRLDGVRVLPGTSATRVSQTVMYMYTRVSENPLALA